MSEIQDLLNRRNTETAFGSIRSQNEKIFELTIRMDKLHSVVSDLLGEMSELRRLVNLTTAQNKGTGPTAR